jgi:hypothetical protein
VLEVVVQPRGPRPARVPEVLQLGVSIAVPPGQVAPSETRARDRSGPRAGRVDRGDRQRDSVAPAGTAMRVADMLPRSR